MKVKQSLKKLWRKNLVKLLVVGSFGFLVGVGLGVATNKAYEPITYDKYQTCLGDPFLHAMNQVFFYKEMFQLTRSDLEKEIKNSGQGQEVIEIFMKALEKVYDPSFNERTLLNTFIGCLNTN